MRRMILALMLVWGAGQAVAEHMRLTPTWGDRMAAPADAVAVWQVRDAGGALLAEGAEPWSGGPVTVGWTGAGDRLVLGLVSGERAIWQGSRAATDGETGPMPLQRMPAARPCTGCAPGAWQLTALLGEAAAEGAEIMLEGGRVSATGGCNRIVGRFDPAGGIAGPFAMTRMACPAPRMQADDRMIAALEQADGLARGPEGALLILRDGLVLLEARPM